MMKNFLKLLFWTLFALLFLINAFILISGRTYLYKAVGDTYLVGRSGPDITDLNLFENRKIETKNPQVWNESKKYNQFTLANSEKKLFESLGTEAFLIIKNDSIIFEHYWNDYNNKTISNSFSVAKTVVSILIGIAIDEGKIKSVHQKVSDFLPEFKKEGLNKITLKNLLTMSSGLDWTESGANPFSHNAEAYFGTDLRKIIGKLSAIEEPGKQFKYLSGNTQILGFVLMQATGEKISDYASQKLWGPLGAEIAAEWNLDKENGDEKAFCCLYATARDFARIGKLYLNKGKWNGKQIVSEKYVEESITPADLTDEFDKPLDFYGYQWWLIPDYKGHTIHYARGILGQYIINIPEKNITIVRLGHKLLPKTDTKHYDDTYKYIDIALRITK